MSEESEAELAAVLIVAVESGLLLATDATRVIDQEILAMPSPSTWLIDASLARTREDLLTAARRCAQGHPALADLEVWIDAADLACARGDSPEGVGARLLGAVAWQEWPSHLRGLMWDLDEEVGCAHAHRGVPQPKEIARVISSLIAAARRSAWRAALERICVRADGAAEQIEVYPEPRAEDDR